MSSTKHSIDSDQDIIEAIKNVDHITDHMISILHDKQEDFDGLHFMRILSAILIICKEITYKIISKKLTTFDDVFKTIHVKIKQAGIPFGFSIHKPDIEELDA